MEFLCFDLSPSWELDAESYAVWKGKLHRKPLDHGQWEEVEGREIEGYVSRVGEVARNEIGPELHVGYSPVWREGGERIYDPRTIIKIITDPKDM